jgi:hypothetical protein
MACRLKDAETVIDGLRDFFNAGLGTHLLYRFERVQYREQLDEKDMQPVNVYGAEHLLRLFGMQLPRRAITRQGCGGVVNDTCKCGNICAMAQLSCRRSSRTRT